MVASQTHDVAVLTDQIAKLVVSSADEKEFIGKSTAKSKNIKSAAKAIHIAEAQEKQNHNKVVSKKIQKPIESHSAKTKDTDEWESF
jgi:methyl-accepting chemotaxis protein